MVRDADSADEVEEFTSVDVSDAGTFGALDKERPPDDSRRNPLIVFTSETVGVRCWVVTH